MRRKYDDPCLRDKADDLSGGLKSIEIGHRNVHQDDVRAKLTRQVDCFAPVARLRDDLEISLNAEQGSEALSDDDVVFREENGDGAHRDIFVCIAR